MLNRICLKDGIGLVNIVRRQDQEDLLRQASLAADQVEQQLLNQYRSGQVSYSNVITAQATALNARSALVLAAANRQTTAVALIQSLGGGWQAGQ